MVCRTMSIVLTTWTGPVQLHKEVRTERTGLFYYLTGSCRKSLGVLPV